MFGAMYVYNPSSSYSFRVLFNQSSEGRCLGCPWYVSALNSPPTYQSQRLSKNQDVVIKPVGHGYGKKKTNELRILEYLNSLRADKTNATVPVIEFIEHSGWTFSVSQRWSWSTEPEFVDIGEVLDWSLQLIAVSLPSTFLQFLMMNVVIPCRLLLSYTGISLPIL